MMTPEVPRDGPRRRAMKRWKLSRIDKIEELIVAPRKLDERATAVQGERELLVEREVIDQLADDYHRW